MGFLGWSGGFFDLSLGWVVASVWVWEWVWPGGMALWEGWVEVAIPCDEWILYHDFGAYIGVLFVLLCVFGMCGSNFCWW